MFHFKKEPIEHLLKQVEELEHRVLDEIETFTDPVAVKTNLGNLNLISLMKKKVYDKMKEL